MRQAGGGLVALSGSRSSSPSGVQTRLGRIRFSVSVPVLSVQITEAEPSVSTALSRFTSAPRRASIATPTASESVIVGSSPSGTLATIRPIVKLKASFSGRPATSQPIGRNARPAATATAAISHATRRTCASSGLGSASTRSVSAAIRPSSVCMPVRKTSAFASPPTQVEPLKTRSRASISGPGRVAQVSRAVDRLRLAGQGREVDVERALEEPGVRRDPVALRRASRTSPGTSSDAANLSPAAVPDHGRLLREVAPERLHRPLGLALLGEGERGVQEDDRDDRRAEHGRAARRRRAPPPPRAAGRADG